MGTIRLTKQYEIPYGQRVTEVFGPSSDWMTWTMSKEYQASEEYKNERKKEVEMSNKVVKKESGASSDRVKIAMKVGAEMKGSRKKHVNQLCPCGSGIKFGKCCLPIIRAND